VADKSSNDWRATLKQRLTVAFCMLLAWSAAIEARLIYLQVFRHADLAARADRQQSRTIPSPAKRGEILDRNGRILARSVDADTIYAVPTELGDPDQAAITLCRALRDCEADDRRAIADRIRKGRHFAYVRRQVSPDQARRVAELQMEGIGFVRENQRRYPNRELASHLLGYVGVDNVGLGGIEGTYDSLIRGKAGTILVQTDARRHAFSRVERPPTTGASLELTIDQYLQYVAERELRAGVESSGASAGSAVVMDPYTGEILALANAPSFNPNTYRDARAETRRNRAVQDYYEPGSTFKIVTASAGFEERAVSPETMIDASAGSIRFGSRVINDDHNYGVLSFADAIVMSSNVGAIKVALKLGPDTIGDYVKRFGFGRPTSPDFRGESPGMVWDPSSLNDSALASVAMGYQVGVTPLQMAAAVSAVANGGELVQPRAVRAVIREGRRLPVPHKRLGRVASERTMATMTEIMERVVEDGTGKRAKVPGYTVAGKTGTAKKLVNGSYRGHSDYNVSFVGFVPSRQPVFAIVVVVDSPHRVSPYGGVVAGPIFQRIATAALRQYGVPASIDAPEPVLATRLDETGQLPASGPVQSPAVMPLAISASASQVPDLTGLSAREALGVLARLGSAAELRGAGVVVNQWPSPGTPLETGSIVVVTLDRRLPDHGAHGEEQ
jgi:cell division protein FtsI (penicillin-binding protein 3)